jgi:cell division protease FtsH
MADFETAKDKVLMGVERKSMVLSEASKLRTAWHEAGHVMVAKLVPGCDPVHKVSIIPRGRALGVTVQIPEEDILCYTREMLAAPQRFSWGTGRRELVFRTTRQGEQ